jgi:hypothetical protein
MEVVQLSKENQESKSLLTTNQNKITVRVNNNFNLTINLGDSLNLLALIGGIYLIRTITENKNVNKKKCNGVFAITFFLVPVTIYSPIHILTAYLFFALKYTHSLKPISLSRVRTCSNSSPTRCGSWASEPKVTFTP